VDVDKIVDALHKPETEVGVTQWLEEESQMTGTAEST